MILIHEEIGSVEVGVMKLVNLRQTFCLVRCIKLVAVNKQKAEGQKNGVENKVVPAQKIHLLRLSQRK